MPFLAFQCVIFTWGVLGRQQGRQQQGRSHLDQAVPPRGELGPRYFLHDKASDIRFFSQSFHSLYLGSIQI